MMVLKMKQNLQEYLTSWDKEYKAKISNLPICQPDHVKTWTDVQKKEFARVFYHARGHFIDFLWFLGNFSNSKEIKDMVLNNIRECRHLFQPNIDGSDMNKRQESNGKLVISC
jgi:hypothetical protein